MNRHHRDRQARCGATAARASVAGLFTPVIRAGLPPRDEGTATRYRRGK